jgi:putative membrane protein
MSKRAPTTDDFLLSPDNQLLYPLSPLGASAWMDKSVDEIHEALAQKPKVHFHHTESEAVERVKMEDGHTVINGANPV